MAEQTFRECVTEVLQNSNILMTALELAERVNQRGFRKRNGETIDARYVAWMAADYPDNFDIFIRLRGR